METKPNLFEMVGSYFNMNLHPDKSLIQRVQGLSDTLSVNDTDTSTAVPIDIEQYNLISELLGTPDQRIAKYGLFDHIDERYADASVALDLFADETIVNDLEHQAPFWPISEDNNIVDLMEDLFYDVLQLRDGAYLNTIVRNMCKYGDNFNEVVIGNIAGVYQLKELPIKSCYVKFKIDGTILGYEQRFLNSVAASYRIEFEPWQIFHMKLPSKTTGAIFGNSILNDAVLPARMLEAVELAAMLSRINGATDRYIFKVPVGNKSSAEAQAYIKEVAASVRRKQAVNTNNGQFVSVNDIMTSLEDLFIPQRESGSIEIEKLEKRSSVNDSIDDINYFDKKTKSALKLPFSFIDNEQPLQLKSLSAGDLRFARRVMKIQAIVKKFLMYVGNLHLDYVWYGQKPDWTVQLASVSQLEELAALENMEMRFNLANTMLDHLPDIEIYTKILKYPEAKAMELIAQMKRQKAGMVIDDAVSAREAEIKSNQLASQYNLPPEEALTQELRLMMLHNPNLRTAVSSLVEVNKQLLEAKTLKSKK